MIIPQVCKHAQSISASKFPRIWENFKKYLKFNFIDSLGNNFVLAKQNSFHATQEIEDNFLTNFLRKSDEDLPWKYVNVNLSKHLCFY